MKYHFLLFFISVFVFSCKNENNMDLIIVNAKIYTVDSNFSTASAMAIKDGRFVEIGNENILKNYTSTEIFDAKGKFIYPGFIDAHCHFTGQAMDEYKLNLFGTSSFDEIIEKVNEYALTCNREWIEGRGWDQNDWKDKSFPTKEKLDLLFPTKPVFLLRVDGHAALCNQAALNAAKITCDFKIEGGENVLKNGECSGILIDNALDKVKNVIPKLTEQEAISFFKNTEQTCFENGLTGVVDCGISNPVVPWIQKACATELAIRCSIMLSDEPENFTQYLNNKPKQTDNFNCFGFKFYSDGALGSRGAYLLNDYEDRHQHKGFLLKSIDSLQQIANVLKDKNFQMCTHAIGDGAVHEILKVYANALKSKNDKRWRIEHTQVVNENDFHFFGDYNIIPSVQPTHATSDMYWAEERIGKERIKNAYAYKKLLLQNAWMPLGTDFPVESINPLYTFCSAVFRQDDKGFPAIGFQKENALSRKEALRGMTIWAAKSTFEEKQKGSIERNKFADFVILDIDLMTADLKTIRNAKVENTFVDGVKVFGN